ncbi:signal peptidase II [Mobiluncus holmesii]|uniref:Lipoprotein signal peptidase n=1 Tax=Mobiluncus porci TaxID=2652278 RepID=A0A7K0K4V3_9ACTO|nr:signal peptidase II [Mobiluncus porci]
MHFDDEPTFRAQNKLGRWFFVLLICVVVAVLDQLTKAIAKDYLPENPADAVPLIGNFITLHLTHNSGAALSLLNSKTLVVTAISVILVFAVLFAALLTPHRSWAGVLAMIAGGGMGNLMDRGRGEPWGTGAVIDFIDYFGFFVGNVADIFVVLGVVAVFVLIIRKKPLDVLWLSKAQIATLESQGKAENTGRGKVIWVFEDASVSDNSASAGDSTDLASARDNSEGGQ